MIAIEHVVAMAIQDRTVLDQLGQALRSNLVLANPYYLRIATFADDFMLDHRTLPAPGDWEVWLKSLPEGMIQTGTQEALGRLLALDLSTFTPAYFAPQAIEHLKQAAAQVALARLNEIPNATSETFLTLAGELEQIQLGNIRGLAYLADLDTWAQPLHEDDLIPTGFPTLDRFVGGWGKELWIVFADSGVGKSMFLQNCVTNVARIGKRALHLSLEIGVRPQMHRYYRQLAQVTRAEFQTDQPETHRRLRHWLRIAKGEIIVLEYPAYSLDPDGLKRTIERLLRVVGPIDVLALDYLDLMVLPKDSRGGGRYEDLGRITHEIRSLCSSYDMTVLTASQAVRRPERAGRLSMRDMGDSYKKVQGADGLLSLVQTEEEEEMRQGRLGLLKIRDGGGRNNEIVLYMNKELSLLQELDHPNTIELMRKLGHLPDGNTLKAVGS